MLIATSGTAVVEPDPPSAETDESAPKAIDPVNGRNLAERQVPTLPSKGVDVRIIRLAPYVYGRGLSGIKIFMGMFIQYQAAPRLVSYPLSCLQMSECCSKVECTPRASCMLPAIAGDFFSIPSPA